MAGVCSGSNFPNCSADYNYVTPDPDIAGIGVVASFIVVNGLTIIVTTISILFVKLQDLDFCGFDLAIYKWFKRHGFRSLDERITEEKIEFWLNILEKVLLGLSDTQLLTGMAVLIAGYVKCNISVYHSSIVSDLAWFASGTHLSSLQILKRYLVEHPATRILRVLLLLAMGGLLFSLTVYQGNQLWYDSTTEPAQCLFVDTVGNVGGAPAYWMSANISLILLGYGSTILFLFPEYVKSSHGVVLYKKAMRKASGGVQMIMSFLKGFPSTVLSTQDTLEIAAILIKLVAALLIIFPLAALCAILYFFSLMIDSYFVGALFDIFWFFFGLYYLLQDRANGVQYMKEEDQSVENQWGFGQFVPMFLIFLPMMTAWEIWYEAYCDDCTGQERKARVAGISHFPLSTTLSPTHHPGRRSSSVDTDDLRRKERAEHRAFDDQLVESLRPPPRAHSRAPSIESFTEGEVGVQVYRAASTSRENLIPPTSGNGHDVISQLRLEEDPTPIVIDISGLGQSTGVNGEESVSRRSTFRS